MKKLLIAIYGLLVGAYAMPSYAADPFFNPNTNVLTLPTVSIGNAVYYNVNILLNPSAFGNGWLTLPKNPCVDDPDPSSCNPNTQPQLIALTISGPDSLEEGTSASYYTQSSWMRYYVDTAGKILYEITEAKDLPISLSGSGATIAGLVVTAKHVASDQEVVLTVYDSKFGVAAQASKRVKIIKIKTITTQTSIPNFRDLYPGTIFTTADGRSWIMALKKDDGSESKCVVPQTNDTGTSPAATIYQTATGYILAVVGSPVSCPIEPL